MWGVWSGPLTTTEGTRLLQPLLNPKTDCITDCCFFIDDVCVVFIFNFVFSVIVGLYVDIYIFTMSSAAVHVL